MHIQRWVILGMAMSLLLLSRSVPAHHGTAIFDMTQSATIKGTVVDYELINPHVQMIIKVEQEGGKTQDWNVEAVSLNMMVRAGFRKDTLKTGDVVSVTGHPGKNGKPAMLLMKIVLANGQTLSAPYE